MIKFVGLESSKSQKVGMFSAGIKRKLAIAKSIINNLGVLFMDEPSVGLDPQSQKMVRDLVMDLAFNQEITVF